MKISIAPSATAAEKNAANVLRTHLARMASAESDPLVFAVGPEAALAAGARAGDLRGLGDEGYVIIRRAGGKIILTGGPGSKRGTLYAAFGFLERVCGCRWWTADVDFVPAVPLRLPRSLDIREIPDIELRTTDFWYRPDPEWMAANRINSGEMPEEWGGGRGYAAFVHTMIGTLVPADKVAAHPEWQAVVDGKPNPEQLCLSRPEVLAETIAGARRVLKAHPRAEIISVSQMDNHVYCHCPACAAVDARAGSPAGSMLRFVNKVAEAIENEFPRVAVDTLAYLYTRKAPRGVRPRRNVIVRLCTFECDFLHPLDHSNNRLFMRDLRAWSRISKRLYIWDYNTNFAHYTLPHPNWFVLGENMRLLHKHNVRGVFAEGSRTCPGGEMAELKTWVLMKLMWDPGLDGNALIREFLRGYFGPAAGHIWKYMRRLHAAAMRVKHYAGSANIRKCLKQRGYPEGRTGAYLDLNAEPEAPWLTPKVVLGGLADFAAALQKVAGDKAARGRVSVARLPLEYCVLLRWDEMRAAAGKTGRKWPLAGTRAGAFAGFERVCKAAGITILGEEWSKRDLPWLRGLCAGK